MSDGVRFGMAVALLAAAALGTSVLDEREGLAARVAGGACALLVLAAGAVGLLSLFGDIRHEDVTRTVTVTTRGASEQPEHPECDDHGLPALC